MDAHTSRSHSLPIFRPPFRSLPSSTNSWSISRNGAPCCRYIFASLVVNPSVRLLTSPSVSSSGPACLPACLSTLEYRVEGIGCRVEGLAHSPSRALCPSFDVPTRGPTRSDPGSNPKCRRHAQKLSPCIIVRLRIHALLSNPRPLSPQMSATMNGRAQFCLQNRCSGRVTWKVPFIVILYNEYTRALNFQTFSRRVTLYCCQTASCARRQVSSNPRASDAWVLLVRGLSPPCSWLKSSSIPVPPTRAARACIFAPHPPRPLG